MSNLEAMESRLPNETVESVSLRTEEAKINSKRAPVHIQNLTERIFSARPNHNEIGSRDPYEIINRNIQNEVLRTEESEKDI